MKVTILNKRTITILALVILLVVAALINIKLSNRDEKIDADTSAPEIEIETISENQGVSITKLTQYEAERKIERQKEMQYLDEIIKDDNTDEATRKLANEQKLSVIENISIEQVIAEVLVGKGFKDVTVVCGNESVNVLLEGIDLDDAKVAQILDVAIREANITPENVKIIPLD